MRFSVVVACFSACAAPVTALSIFDKQPAGVAGDSDHKVPGDSPMELCPGEHDQDLITIKSVDLSPNPPKAGQELLITASGTVKKTIQEGAYVKLIVKYGLIRLISTTADLCEQIKNVDLKCPIEAGDLSITKSVDLPAEIPPGKYTVEADVYTVDDVKITCLTATVPFSRSSFFSNELK